MKKFSILLMFVMIMFLVMRVEAGSWKTNAKITIGFQNLNIGTYLSLKEGEIYVGGSIPIVSWEKVFSVDIGLASDLENRPIPLGSLSLDVQELAGKLGWIYKLLDPMKIGGWYGRVLEDGKFDEEDYGIYATLTYEL